MIKIEENKKTTISITPRIRDELKQIGTKDEEYEEILKRTITFTKKFSDERTFHKWVGNNFHLFGFDSLLESNYHKSPDLVMTKNGKKIKVEVETLSSNFILHKHDPNEIDLVICLIKNKELPVKTIEIEPFEFELGPDSITKTSVNLSKKQIEWFHKYHVNLSSVIREKVEEFIKEHKHWELGGD